MTTTTENNLDIARRLLGRPAGRPSCHACGGSGIDSVFKTPCTECHIEGARTFPRVAQPAPAPKFRSGAGCSTPRNSTIKMASEGQVKFIRDLARKTGATHTPGGKLISEVVDPRTIVNGRSTFPGFSSNRASQLIDHLKSLPLAEVQPEARRNRREQKCERCGQMVPAGEGLLHREEKVTGVSGRQAVSNIFWTVTHDGECPRSEQDQLEEMLEGRPDGYFAIPFIGKGEVTDLTFFGIRTIKTGRRKGQREVVHTVGGHGDLTNLSLEWVAKALEVLDTVDINEAAALYGTELGHCGRCGKTLTNDDSREIGIGPDCLKKGNF